MRPSTGSPGLRTSASPQVDDEKVDRALRDLERRLGDLSKLPGAGLRVVGEFTLSDGVETLIPHGLGRPPSIVLHSPVEGAMSSGRVERVRSTAHDQGRYVVLKATGYTVPITLTVAVA